MAQPIVPELEPKALQFPRLRVLRLDVLCQDERFRTLDTSDAYATCKQYEGCAFNWDGMRMGYGGEADLNPGFVVPMRQRRPHTRFNLGKLVTGRLTAMALGEDAWPQITVTGDPTAEDYVRALVKESKLASRIQEARKKGGGCGTAVVSFGFVEGRPRVKVHDAKFMRVVEWKDRDEHVIRSVLKCYRYSRTVWIEGRPKEVNYYFARYWDENTEVVWEPIPEALARAGTWSEVVPSHAVEHGYGECPVYWCQNLPDTEREDGLSDLEGLHDTMDQINYLLSATGKGTIANVDPTLVIHDDPGSNSGVVRKGSGQAIYSKGGAEYLELKGESVKTAVSLTDALIRYCLEVSGVVNADPDKVAARAQSAAAMKMLYLPMLNQCNALRTQYGTLILAVARGMLRAARRIQGQPPGPVVTTTEGLRLQAKPTVVLPPRYDPVEGEPDPETGEAKRTLRKVERKPGQSEFLELVWPTYFPATANDTNQAVEAATKAKGQTISQRTAVAYTAQLFGVQDVDAEVAMLDVERERNMALMGGGLDDFPEPPPGKKDEDEEGEPED